MESENSSNQERTSADVPREDVQQQQTNTEEENGNVVSAAAEETKQMVLLQPVNSTSYPSPIVSHPQHSLPLQGPEEVDSFFHDLNQTGLPSTTHLATLTTINEQGTNALTYPQANYTTEQGLFQATLYPSYPAPGRPAQYPPAHHPWISSTPTGYPSYRPSGYEQSGMYLPTTGRPTSGE
ncbi:unnamed protein product [Dimorphilus gyrociliatus]|uniref:Uncharacterized protein n=1 Tax=Dimorphilus gyrociliatus TaxID=2664684 RepID=A0A7I8VGR5_9ANNE|nr:unnamed protein product [Dimorphilus gyrociliatus]